MDKAAYVDKRRKRYLAQLLDAFEELVEPHVAANADRSVAEFKGLVRAKMNALAIDAADLIDLDPSVELNGYAAETTDRLYPNGRPHHQGARA